jgi:hypothetical protein
LHLRLPGGESDTVFLPLLTTLVLLGQAPPSAEKPLSVLIAPPEAAGLPSHIVSFSQEHLYEQLKMQGLRVVRISELSQRLPPAQRKAVLGCDRLEPACRGSLGEAAQVELVMLTELVSFPSGYRVTLKAYTSRDGAPLAEQSVAGVKEEALLEALTRNSERLVPQVLQVLRPPPPVQAPKEDAPLHREESAPKPALASGPSPWVWAPAAGGAVLLGAGTYFLGRAHRDFTTLKKGPGPVDNGSQLVASGKRAQDLSRAAFALGATGVVASGILHLLSAKGPPPVVHPTVSVGPQGAMIGMAGTLP